MNVRELKEEFDKLGINPDFYSLTGEVVLDGITLKKLKHMWYLFYTEPFGVKSWSQLFDTEDQACRYFLEAYKEDLDYLRKKDEYLKAQENESENESESESESENESEQSE